MLYFGQIKWVGGQIIGIDGQIIIVHGQNNLRRTNIIDFVYELEFKYIRLQFGYDQIKYINQHYDLNKSHNIQ